MKSKIIGAVVTFFLWGSLALVPASAQVGAAPGGMSAPNSHHGDEVWDWYQGKRGHWRQDKGNGQWHWFGADNDHRDSDHRDSDHRDNDEATARGSNQPWDWYQGHRGRWQNERGGWHFRSQDLVCNNNGKNCRRGAELPSNGEGMVNVRNPKFFWHCDSDGHHCNWARRPGM